MENTEHKGYRLYDKSDNLDLTLGNIAIEAIDQDMHNVEQTAQQASENVLSAGRAIEDLADNLAAHKQNGLTDHQDIAQSIGNVEAAANAANALAVTANGNATTAQSTADSAQSTASAAQGTANTALANAATAQTAANNANANANGREPAFIREWTPTPTGSTFPQGALVRHNGRLWQNVDGANGGSAPWSMPSRWQEVLNESQADNRYLRLTGGTLSSGNLNVANGTISDSRGRVGHQREVFVGNVLLTPTNQDITINGSAGEARTYLLYMSFAGWGAAQFIPIHGHSNANLTSFYHHSLHHEGWAQVVNPSTLRIRSNGTEARLVSVVAIY